jgi:hypothetical protein
MQIPSILAISNPIRANGLRRASQAVAAFLMAASPFCAAAAPASSPVFLAPPPAVTTLAGNSTDLIKTDAIDFAIVIPAILRLLENDHPAELQPLAGPAMPIAALQRVVLVSTLRSGFCMDLRLNARHAGQAQVADWQVQLAALSGAAAASGARVEAVDGGWRVCTRRAGRFELALQHAFSVQPRAAQAGVNLAVGTTDQAPPLGWPVALSLSTP